MYNTNSITHSPIAPAQVSFSRISLEKANTFLTSVSSLSQSEPFLGVVNDVYSVSPTYFLHLPDAKTLAPPAQSQFICQNAFKLVDFEGNLIKEMSSGTNVIVTLLENGTSAGYWLSAQLTSQTSQANAADLAGLGLRADEVSSKINVQPKFYDFDTTPFTFTKAYQASFINWIGNNGTVTLPKAGVIIGMVGTGYWLIIKNSSPGNGVLTIDVEDDLLIDGSPTFNLFLGQSATFYCDGTNYQTVGYNSINSSSAVIISPSGLKLIDGTAVQPSLAFIDSPTTGLFSPGSSKIAITSGGTEVVNFDNAGLNIKITDTSSSAIGLSVNGDDILYFNGIYP